jgi:CrcB protein
MVNYLQIFLVGLGGSLGAIGRFKLGGLVMHHAVVWRFPLGTYVVNVLGCLVVGIISGLIERHDLFSPDTRLFLITGILGGFTTFSAFGLETVFLFRRGEIAIAIAYMGLSLVCGVASVWLGFSVVPHRTFE